MDTAAAVAFSPRSPDVLPPVVALAARRAAAAAPGDISAALQTAVLLGQQHHAWPGAGATAALWEALATTASIDLGAARAIEPHLDALAILNQADDVVDVAAASDSRTWGVFASEAPAPLRAKPNGAVWQLDGLKPWCSLADRLSAALVSATDDAGKRRLFAVDLGDPGVRVIPESWHARGLTEVPSGPVEFTAVRAHPVGDAGWYLSRPGFSWGGIGVAACWFGGAVGLARSVFAATQKRDSDRLLLMHLGAIDEQLQSARRALAEAAAHVDAGDATGDAGRLLAKRVRATVARCCEEVLLRTAHALGPAPLAQDAVHSKRVADLQLYVRQYHAERDEASLGEALTSQETTPW